MRLTAEFGHKFHSTGSPTHFLLENQQAKPHQSARNMANSLRLHNHAAVKSGLPNQSYMGIMHHYGIFHFNCDPHPSDGKGRQCSDPLVTAGTSVSKAPPPNTNTHPPSYTPYNYPWPILLDVLLISTQYQVPCDYIQVNLRKKMFCSFFK